MTSSLQWSRVMRLAEARPWTIGFALEIYRQSTDSDVSDLAAFLGCSTDSLSQLAVCRRPTDPASFRSALEMFASDFLVSAEKLGTVLRLADAVEELRAAGDAPDAVLRAARDRKPLVDDD